MKLLISLILLLVVLAPLSNAISVPVGESAPDFSLSNTDGDTVTISKYRDKALLLLFWRTGQKRSEMALKDTDDIIKKYGKKGIEAVCVIESSDNQTEALKVIKDMDIKCPMYIDSDRKAYGSYGIRVFPTTVIIDREGKLAYDIPSHPLTFKMKLEGYVRRVLGEINDEELANVLDPQRTKTDDATLESMRLYNLAMKFVKMKMIDQAVDTAEKSVEAKPDLIDPLTLLGFLYLETDQAEKALEIFSKAAELEPDSKDVMTGLGGALVMNKEYDKAIEVLDKATIANPYSQMTYYELGKAYELKGDKEKSIEMYKKAIEKIVKKQILPSSLSKCQ